MHGERIVGGISCSDVLADLSDYLDDQLPAERRDQIDAHLRGCDTCERFGGQFAAIITALRRSLASPEALDDDVARRLDQRLRAEIR